MAAFDPLEYIFQVQAEERSRFEKLSKEEQDRVLAERRVNEEKRRQKEWARGRRAEGWRKWRGGS